MTVVAIAAPPTVLWTLRNAGRHLRCAARQLPQGFELQTAIDEQEPFFSRRFDSQEQLLVWAEEARARSLAKGWEAVSSAASPLIQEEHTRRYRRTSVSFPVDVLSYSAGAKTRDEGRLVLLGAGGAFLELAGSYDVGGMLRLGFELPSTPGEIACAAIVRDRLAKGVGVEFLELVPRDRDRIDGFVTRHLGG